MTTTPPPTPPLLSRPTFHVWLVADDQDPDTTDPAYVGLVAVTNQDQLVAELQARKVGVPNVRETPFHLTNLWLWAACVRRGLTSARFQEFARRMEYQPTKDGDQAAQEEAEAVDPLQVAALNSSSA